MERRVVDKIDDQGKRFTADLKYLSDKVDRGEKELGSRVDALTTRVVQGKADLEHRMMKACLLYTSPSPRDLSTSRMPSSA